MGKLLTAQNRREIDDVGGSGGNAISEENDPASGEDLFSGRRLV